MIRGRVDPGVPTRPKLAKKQNSLFENILGPGFVSKNSFNSKSSITSLDDTDLTQAVGQVNDEYP